MIELSDIQKRYELGGEVLMALDHVDLTVGDHEYVAIIGPSGSGKSTLMNIIGCLDTADGGTYKLDGLDITRYSQRQLAAIRGHKIGFIFQQFNLLQKLTAYENVELPLIYQGIGAAERRLRVGEALERVGLGSRMHHRPNQLSGGQQQRVSIGRALMNAPMVVLADEPTGNLDSKNSQEIVELLKLSNRKYNQTLIVITHDENIALQADRVIAIEDGKITRDEVIRK